MPEVEKLLNKADDTIEDARKAFEEEMLVSTIQNRIYYSIFYAAQAALISVGEDAGSHQGVKVELGKNLIQNGDLDKEWGRSSRSSKLIANRPTTRSMLMSRERNSKNTWKRPGNS